MNKWTLIKRRARLKKGLYETAKLKKGLNLKISPFFNRCIVRWLNCIFRCKLGLIVPDLLKTYFDEIWNPFQFFFSSAMDAPPTCTPPARILPTTPSSRRSITSPEDQRLRLLFTEAEFDIITKKFNSQWVKASWIYFYNNVSLLLIKKW